MTGRDTELRKGIACQPLSGGLNPSGVGRHPHSLCPQGEKTWLVASGCGVCGGRGPAAESPGRSADLGGLTDSKQRSYIKVEARAMKSELFLANKFPPGVTI